MKTKKTIYIFCFVLINLMTGINLAQVPKLDWLITQKIYTQNVSEIAQKRNNVYKAGNHTGTLLLNPSYTDTIISSNNGSNKGSFIVRYDTSGNYVKGISLNAQSNGQVPSYNTSFELENMEILPNGNIVVTGNYRGTPRINDTTKGIGIVNGKFKGFIICLDSNLNFVWGNSVANLPRHSVGSVFGADLNIAQNQWIYSSFNITYPATDSGIYYGLTIPFIHNRGNRVILKINPYTGALSNLFSEWSGYSIQKHCSDTNGNIYFCRGGNIYKKNKLFNPLWNKNYTVNIGSEFSSILYHQGYLYASGTTYSNFDGIPLTNKTGFFAKIDTSNGNVIWKKLYTEPSSNSVSFSKVYAKNQELLLAGTFKKSLYFGIDSLVCNGGNFHDGFIIKYDTSGNRIFKSTIGGPSSESNILINEQGNTLYVSFSGRTNTNFVLDGSTPQYLTQNFTTGFAKYSSFRPSSPPHYPVVNLGNDTTICSGSGIRLSSGLSTTYNHLWSTGDTSTSIFIFSSGNYWLHILDSIGNVIASDTLNITIENLNFSLGNDTTFIDSITISSPYLTGSFLWNTGDTSSAIVVKSSGLYWVTYVSKNGCPYSDTLYLQKQTMGIKEYRSNSMKLYPNPTKNMVFVENLIENEVFNYKIISTVGNIVHEGTIINGQINIEQLIRGSYIIVIYNHKMVKTRSITKI